MLNRDDNASEYKVGPGRPPIEHQFKIGNEGGPGRPRKYISLLKEQGYKLSEIADSLMALLSMTPEELDEVFNDPKATVFEKAIAAAVKKSIEKGDLTNVETIITRALGKPKENVVHSGDEKNPIYTKHTVTFKKFDGTQRTLPDVQ